MQLPPRMPLSYTCMQGLTVLPQLRMVHLNQFILAFYMYFSGQDIFFLGKHD